MNLKLNLSYQGLLTLMQGFNWLALPGRIQLAATLLISIIQALLAAKAQMVNPDGQPATVAYRRPE